MFVCFPLISVWRNFAETRATEVKSLKQGLRFRSRSETLCITFKLCNKFTRTSARSAKASFQPQRVSGARSAAPSHAERLPGSPAVHMPSPLRGLLKSLAHCILLDCLFSSLVLWEFFIKSECKSFGRYETCKYFLSQQPVSSFC